MKYYQVLAVSQEKTETFDCETLEEAVIIARTWSNELESNCYVSIHEIIDVRIYYILNGMEYEDEDK